MVFFYIPFLHFFSKLKTKTKKKPHESEMNEKLICKKIIIEIQTTICERWRLFSLNSKKNGNCQFFLVQKTKFENNTLLALIDLKEKKHRIDSKKVIRKKNK